MPGRPPQNPCAQAAGWYGIIGAAATHIACGPVGANSVRPRDMAATANPRIIVGADSISARATLCNHPTARRGQDPSLQTNHKLSSNPQNRNPAKSPGASRTPPPTFNHASGVGANIVRPCSWVATLDSAGGCKHPPLRNPKVTFRPRRGQSEEDAKALRKMQHSCIF